MKPSLMNYITFVNLQRGSVRPLKIRLLRTKRSVVIYLLTLISLGGMAQGNFSPYSQMGLGDIEDGFYNRTTGLGNTGIAYRSNRFLINNNQGTKLAVVSRAKRVRRCRRNKPTYFLGPGKNTERTLENQHSRSLTLEPDCLG